MTVSQSLDKIINLAQDLQNISNVLDYEQIEKPLTLAQSILELGHKLFSNENLEQLAEQDPDTLDTWAITLKQTLEIEFNLLNSWLNILTYSDVPEPWKENIQERSQQIQEIDLQKTNILTETKNLISKENNLKQDFKELQELQQKIVELTEIEQELQQHNLDKLRQEVKEKTDSLIPQQEQLHQLQDEKADIEAQIEALQQQKQKIDQEIDSLKNQDSNSRDTLLKSGKQLITLEKPIIDNLNSNLQSTLDNIKYQEEERKKIQNEWQEALDNYDEWQQKNTEIRQKLETHYDTNKEIEKLLPINQQKITEIIKLIQQNLSEFDQELSKAQKNHEQAQQKNYFNF